HRPRESGAPLSRYSLASTRAFWPNDRGVSCQRRIRDGQSGRGERLARGKGGGARDHDRPEARRGRSYRHLLGTGAGGMDTSLGRLTNPVIPSGVEGSRGKTEHARLVGGLPVVPRNPSTPQRSDRDNRRGETAAHLELKRLAV